MIFTYANAEDVVKIEVYGSDADAVARFIGPLGSGFISSRQQLHDILDDLKGTCNMYLDEVKICQ